MNNLNYLSPKSEVALKCFGFLTGEETFVQVQDADTASRTIVEVTIEPIENPYCCDRDHNYERHDKVAYHTQIIPKGRYVGETIGNDFKEWRWGESVWMNVNCGTGKTHFFRSLLLYCKTCGYKVLYIGSRVQLMNQNKRLVADELKNGYADCPAEYLEGIEEFDDFVYFASYQQIAEKYRNGKRFRPDVFTNSRVIIFLDEAHWITSDALFSSAPNIFLDSFFVQFRDAIKVFMTATDWECYQQFEKRLPKSRLKLFKDGPALIEQVIAFDKVYISESNRLENAEAFYYEKLESLVPKINSSEEDWFILVESKKQGEELSKQLTKSNFIFRETEGFTMSDKAKAEKDLIVAEEKYESKVLISTAVMDVGTNIKTDKVVNVVVDTWDPVTAVQFVGRIRRGSAPIKIFFHNRTPDDVIGYLRNRINKTLRDIDAHYNGFGNIREYEVTVYTDLLKRGLLYYHDHQLVKNDLAILKLENMQQYLRHVLWETALYEEESFLAHQLELFGFALDECMDSESDIKSQIHEELIAFIDSYIGRALSTEEYSNFCVEFDVFLDRLGAKEHRGAKRYQAEKLNEAFKGNGLPYKVRHDNGVYTITATDAG